MPVLTQATVASIANKLNKTGDIMTGTLTLAGDGLTPLEATTRQQLDAVVSGLTVKAGCRGATVSALTATYANGTAGVGATLTMNAVGAFVQDGVAYEVGDSIAVKNQAAPAQNGIYSVTIKGNGSTQAVLTRRSDYDTSAEIYSGTYTTISEGTINAGTMWYQTTTGAITVGTTAINFSQLNLINVSSPLEKNGSLITLNQALLALASSQISQSIRNANTDTAFQASDVNSTIRFIHTSGLLNCTLPTDVTATIPVGSIIVVTLVGNRTIDGAGTVQFIVEDGVNALPLHPIQLLKPGDTVYWLKEAANRFICINPTNLYVKTYDRDVSNGYPGLTALKINFKNEANTFTSYFSNKNTASKEYLFPNIDGLVNVSNYTVIPDASSGLGLENFNGVLRFTNTTADSEFLMTQSYGPADAYPGSTVTLYNDTGSRLLSVTIPLLNVTVEPFLPTVGPGGVIVLTQVAPDVWRVTCCYEKGTLPCSWSGIWSSSVTGNILFERDMTKVKLDVPTVVSTQNGTSGLITSTAAVLPARLRPLTARFGAAWVYSNAVNTLGGYQIGTGGTITMYYYDTATKNLAANFPISSGQSGFNGTSFPDYLIV